MSKRVHNRKGGMSRHKHSNSRRHKVSRVKYLSDAIEHEDIEHQASKRWYSSFINVLFNLLSRRTI